MFYEFGIYFWFVGVLFCVEDYLCVVEQGYGFVVVFVGYDGILDLGCFVQVYWFGYVGYCVFVGCVEVIGFEFDGGEVYGVFWQVGYVIVVGVGVGQCDDIVCVQEVVGCYQFGLYGQFGMYFIVFDLCDDDVEMIWQVLGVELVVVGGVGYDFFL